MRSRNILVCVRNVHGNNAGPHLNPNLCQHIYPVLICVIILLALAPLLLIVFLIGTNSAGSLCATTRHGQIWF